jgi:HD-like signal output (HDOD) protein
MQEGTSFLKIIQAHLASSKTVLPVFDRTGLRIQRETAKTDPNTAVIEKMVVCDQALTSQVLRMANSAFYKGLTKVSTVNQAMVRLGIGEIANIAMLASQKKSFRAKIPTIKKLMDDLWRHSIGCAIGSQWIAKRCNHQARSQEAFTAGLLHDMGKLLILAVTEAISSSGKIKKLPSTELLGEVMDNFHATCGYLLLKKWNLPDDYCAIARDHHKEETDYDDPLLMIVRLANMACNKVGVGIRGKEEITLAATHEADELGLSEILLAELEIKLEDAQILAQ